MTNNKIIRGIKIAYEDIGNGTPIVMIHGQPFNRSMWDYQVNELKSDYRLIIPDLRGYGESDVPKGMVLLDELALDIAELLEELEIREVILMGLSMGGQIALEFFKLFPKRVKGIVLADTDCRSEDEEGYKRRLVLSEKIANDGMIRFTEERIHHFISEYSMKNLPKVVAHLRKMMETTSSLGSSLVQRGRAERKDLTALLDEIDVPSLIFVGEYDEFTPVTTAEFIHKRISNSKLVIIEQAGHIPNMEQPIIFNSKLKSFLGKNFKTNANKN